MHLNDVSVYGEAGSLSNFPKRVICSSKIHSDAHEGFIWAWVGKLTVLLAAVIPPTIPMTFTHPSPFQLLQFKGKGEEM
jgi:hypothetical protein